MSVEGVGRSGRPWELQFVSHKFGLTAGGADVKVEETRSTERKEEHNIKSQNEYGERRERLRIKESGAAGGPRSSLCYVTRILLEKRHPEACRSAGRWNPIVTAESGCPG
jgi:hypothetical protein